jgi:hypothetical protein
MAEREGYSAKPSIFGPLRPFAAAATTLLVHLLVQPPDASAATRNQAHLSETLSSQHSSKLAPERLSYGRIGVEAARHGGKLAGMLDSLRNWCAAQ